MITADNVLMICTATVSWRITDVTTAAVMAANTMEERDDRDHIKKLRKDVLKQAEASLSSFIGTINFSDNLGASAKVQVAAQAPVLGKVADGAETSSALFDEQRLDCAVAHANRGTSKYGVSIISLNIISGFPADGDLLTRCAPIAPSHRLQCGDAKRGRRQPHPQGTLI